MKIPCNNCVCLAVCRHKNYFNLTQCYLLQQYIESYNRGNISKLSLRYRCIILKNINPSKWKVNKHGYFINEDGNEITQKIYRKAS